MSQHFKLTQYGFEWGKAIVERVASTPKWGVVLDVRSSRHLVQIRVTPSGLIRVGAVHKGKGTQ